MDYQELLKDIRWKSKAKEIRIRDKEKCRNCGSNNNLQVHHRQYHFISNLNDFKKPWDYPNQILVTLCKQCHTIGHKLYNIPTIKI